MSAARSSKSPRATEVAAALEACPVCSSRVCADLTRAAGSRWRQEAALRARTFHDPTKFGGVNLDPGTVCQTTRKPLPTVAA